MISQGPFQPLKRFVFPKYHEEGPPEFVRALLLGHTFFGEDMSLSIATKTVLELMTIGYRPATTLAILHILSESPTSALSGMQIGRELEKRFDVQEGWFTRTRYYSDRVGKLLTLLTRLDFLEEVVRKDPKGGRGFTAYQIKPRLVGPVKTRISELSRGLHVSLFSTEPQVESAGHRIPPESFSDNPRECVDCRIVVNSASARYCERCGKVLKLNCSSCKGGVDAIYDYCPKCGSKML